jgi:hypothetical protein
MIQIKIDVEQMKSGRISIEMQTGISKKRPPTGNEEEVACKLKETIAIIVSELARLCPGSSLAIGADDVETLKSLCDLR